MINAITCSMLESPCTSDYDEINNGVSKSTVLEPTTKQLMKKTGLDLRAAHNWVRRGQNIRAETSPMEKVSLKATRGCSRYHTITKRLIEEIVEQILSHTNFNPSCVSHDDITVLNQVSNLK